MKSGLPHTCKALFRGSWRAGASREAVETLGRLNATLTSLDIWGHGLGQGGGPALADSETLRPNTTLSRRETESGAARSRHAEKWRQEEGVLGRVIEERATDPLRGLRGKGFERPSRRGILTGWGRCYSCCCCCIWSDRFLLVEGSFCASTRARRAHAHLLSTWVYANGKRGSSHLLSRSSHRPQLSFAKKKS